VTNETTVSSALGLLVLPRLLLTKTEYGPFNEFEAERIV
jgi:hypothetical protein